MYIDRISLTNIRGFDQLDFSFARPDKSYAGWTVFTGDNGAGKSTVLKAIAIALTGRDTARALQPSFHRWIREGQGQATVEIDVVHVAGDDTFSSSGVPPKKAFPASISLKNGGKEPQLDIALPPGKPKTYVTPQRSIWAQDAGGWFSCGYGPFRRVFGASAEAMRQMVAPATEHFVTMFQEAASLAEVDQWLRHLSHKKLEGKQQEQAQLELVLQILRDEFVPNRMTVDGVDSDGLWLSDRNGVRLSWSDMSDGYRTALALLLDILRHLFNTYGPEHLTDHDENGRIFIRRSGVVLIDEVDAHLHPEWQREIGFWLKRHFPNIQFLVTTHSPLVCQAADPNGLFVLPEPGSGDKPRALSDKEYRTVIAAKSDTILRTAAFGLENTRSPVAVEAAAEYSRLKAKEMSGIALNKEEKLQVRQLESLVLTDED